METMNVSVHSCTSNCSEAVSQDIMIIWFTVSITICAFGSVITLLLLLTLLAKRNFVQGANILIIHLLCIEVITMSTIYPLSTTIIYMNQPIISCVPVIFCLFLLQGVAHYTCAFLALNRFVAFLLPHQYRSFSTGNVLSVTLVISWMFPLTAAVPPLFDWGGHYGRFLPLGYCGLIGIESSGFALITTINSTIPLASQGVCYLIIGCRILTGHRKSSLPATKQQQKARCMANMLIISWLWYLLCFLPTPVIVTYAPWLWTENGLVVLCLRTALLCGSTGTPIVFIMMNEDYRKDLRAHVTKIVPLSLNFRQVRSANSSTV